MTTRVERVENAAGRVDLLLLRLGQHITGLLERRIEQRLGIRSVELWPHVEPLVRGEIKRRRIPSRSLKAHEVVELVLNGKGPRRLKCT